MTTSSIKLRWYQDPEKLFIAAGIVGALVLFWFANGQPGRALKAGDYGCAQGHGPGELVGFYPALTVEGGKVVDAWTFDMATGAQSSVPFSDVERHDPKTFSVTSVDDFGTTIRLKCTID